jgi:SAM-dependent methyltransferase
VSAERERVFVNAGCGPAEAGQLPAYFDGWRQVRVDSDPAVSPDVIADLTDLAAIPDGSVDAVWAAHCVEHVYEHQVPIVLAEFRRVLRADGFAVVIVPDLQGLGHYLSEDRLHEEVYRSAAGPVSAHDMIFGFGAAIAGGRASMAHRCGFTPGTLQRCFRALPFAETLLRRRGAQMELVALARASAAPDDATRVGLMNALGL